MGAIALELGDGEARAWRAGAVRCAARARKPRAPRRVEIDHRQIGVAKIELALCLAVDVEHGAGSIERR